MQNNEFDVLDEQVNDEFLNQIMSESGLSQNTDEQICNEISTLEVKPENYINHEIQDININQEIQDINIEQETQNINTNQETPEVKINKNNNFISWILFLFKYILTSSLIFWILLLTTNYSAYTNIAKSYIYKNEQKTESNWIINSVEAWNIKEKYRENLEKNNLEENDSNSDYSLKKLINNSNKNNLDINIEITPYDNRIVIPKIWKNIPLLDIENKKIDWYKELDNIFMKELENWVIRYPWSAKPWNDWTTFIFGHSSNFPWVKWDYNDVFSLLDKVEYEDEIIIYYGQKKYKYKIREKKVVSPGNVSILKRDKNKSEITLMTCWPIWTTLNRLIVTWELVE